MFYLFGVCCPCCLVFSVCGLLLLFIGCRQRCSLLVACHCVLCVACCVLRFACCCSLLLLVVVCGVLLLCAECLLLIVVVCCVV